MRTLERFTPGQGKRNERELQQREFESRDKKQEQDSQRELRIAKNKKKIETAEPFSEIDFSRQSIEGIEYTDFAKNKDNVLVKALSRLHKITEKHLQEKGLIRKLELVPQQEQEIKEVQAGFERYLLKYNCSSAEFSKDKIFSVKGLDQFGIGGIDTLLGNNIYLSEDSLSPRQFLPIFSHEYAHFISARKFTKGVAGNLEFEKWGTEKIQSTKFKSIFGEYDVYFSGHKMINEGVTDLFSARVLMENNKDASALLESASYKHYREVVARAAMHLGKGNYNNGLDYFIEAYLTGNHDSLVERFNTIYQKQGGYEKFTELLNKVEGYAGNINELEHSLKGNIRAWGKMMGVNLLPIEKDRHYLELIKWLDSTK